MQRWMAKAAGGINQRLNPLPATIAALEKKEAMSLEWVGGKRNRWGHAKARVDSWTEILVGNRAFFPLDSRFCQSLEQGPREGEGLVDKQKANRAKANHHRTGWCIRHQGDRAIEQRVQGNGEKKVVKTQINPGENQTGGSLGHQETPWTPIGQIDRDMDERKDHLTQKDRPKVPSFFLDPSPIPATLKQPYKLTDEKGPVRGFLKETIAQNLPQPGTRRRQG